MKNEYALRPFKKLVTHGSKCIISAFFLALVESKGVEPLTMQNDIGFIIYLAYNRARFTFAKKE